MMSLHNERTNFIEESGIIFEKLGLTRMGGRILGYLMVSDKEMVSFDELTQVLQASKSSISTNLKTLVQVTFIKPTTLPGDRKTYYMLSPDMDWIHYIENRMKLLNIMNQMFKKGHNLRVNQTDKTAKWLQDATSFYEWIVREFPKIIEQYKEETKNNK